VTFTTRLAKSKAPAAHARTHAHNTVLSHPRKKFAAHGKSAHNTVVSHPRNKVAAHRKSATVPGHMKAKPAVAAPSQVPSTTTAHGLSTISPGQTKTTTSASPAKGKSATAPGHATTTTVLVTTTTSTTTTTTTVTTPVHGQSANAPGQTNPVPLVHEK
jgi:hypothetical protein